jgi:hypothetical protein
MRLIAAAAAWIAMTCTASAAVPPPETGPHKQDAAAATAAAAAGDAQIPSPRVADASRARALFAPHSWHVEAPPPPPPPAPPPPAPTAPPLPFTFLGAYAQDGGHTVYFLALADRVIDAHVGDRLEGNYAFESADAKQLVFNYLPLKVHQSLSIGANP